MKHIGWHCWHCQGIATAKFLRGNRRCSLRHDNVPAGSDDNNTSLFVAGDIGIEYNFQIPIIISLDFRPELGFGDFNNDLDFDIALGIRYQF